MAPLVWIGFEASAFTSLKAQQSKPGSLAKTPYLSNWARGPCRGPGQLAKLTAVHSCT